MTKEYLAEIEGKIIRNNWMDEPLTVLAENEKDARRKIFKKLERANNAYLLVRFANHGQVKLAQA